MLLTTKSISKLNEIRLYYWCEDSFNLISILVGSKQQTVNDLT